MARSYNFLILRVQTIVCWSCHTGINLKKALAWMEEWLVGGRGKIRGLKCSSIVVNRLRPLQNHQRPFQ